MASTSTVCCNYTAITYNQPRLYIYIERERERGGARGGVPLWYGFRKYVLCFIPWWRHQMETFSALLAICAGNSPVTRSFDVFLNLRLNKRLSKQSWGWWFETLPHQLWRHSNAILCYSRPPHIQTPNIRKPHHPDVFWQERNFSILFILTYSDIRASVSEQQFGASNNQFNSISCKSGIIKVIASSTFIVSFFSL